jgi:hypothetical protein
MVLSGEDCQYYACCHCFRPCDTLTVLAFEDMAYCELDELGEDGK